MNKTNNNRGFALLYVILIMFLFMITVTAMVFSSKAEIRQYKQAKSSLGAWMAAQSGIEAGIATKTTDTCDNTTPFKINGVNTNDGSYIKIVCPTDNYIESTGIYGGLKIKLRADIDTDGKVTGIYQVGI